MDLGLAGKVALVGGASRGLGRAAAERLAGEGAHVVLSARSAGTLGHTTAEVRAATGAQVRAVAADVTRADDCKRMVAETVEAFGALDILVTNMGGPPYGGDRIPPGSALSGARGSFISMLTTADTGDGAVEGDDASKSARVWQRSATCPARSRPCYGR